MIGVGSLAARLTLASVLLLPLFLGATGLYLERSHRLSIEAAVAERLQLQVRALLAEAEYEKSLWFPEKLQEAQFNLPDSGLYALVRGEDGKLLWQSPSTVALDLPETLGTFQRLASGTSRFQQRSELFQYSYQVIWETLWGEEVPLQFTVMQTVAVVEAQMQSYRRSLLLGLGGSALLLLLCQLVILRWGLRPLRDLATDISSVEAGTVDRLHGSYPREVQALTDSVNTLLQSEQQRRERVRNTLTDLAHSLKTPLAVMRSADTEAPDFQTIVSEQTDLMEAIIAYQLQRSVEGSHKLLQTTSVAPMVQRLRDSLLKVYADKSVQIELDIKRDCQFRGDKRDLMEMLGILMDNACKYGRQTVRVSGSGGKKRPLNLRIEDDGEGVPQELREAILQRGVRADSRRTGQGIGLAVASEIVSSYRGELSVDASELGGACIELNFCA